MGGCVGERHDGVLVHAVEQHGVGAAVYIRLVGVDGVRIIGVHNRTAADV